MNEFTHDELTLMSIYNSDGTQRGLIDSLTDMCSYLDPDETALRALTQSALTKLAATSDADYDALDLFPEFE